MRRKIRGSVYDTEGAEKLASWPSFDIEQVDEALYRTKSGKYFTLEVRLDEDPHQHVIVPQSRADAIRIACRNLGVEAARPLFQDDLSTGHKQLNVRVSARTHEILKGVAGERGVPMGRLIEELVNEGEPFGDDNVVFDEIAEEERSRAEVMERLEAMRKDGAAI